MLKLDERKCDFPTISLRKDTLIYEDQNKEKAVQRGRIHQTAAAQKAKASMGYSAPFAAYPLHSRSVGNEI